MRIREFGKSGLLCFIVGILYTPLLCHGFTRQYQETKINKEINNIQQHQPKECSPSIKSKAVIKPIKRRIAKTKVRKHEQIA